MNLRRIGAPSCFNGGVFTPASLREHLLGAVTTGTTQTRAVLAAAGAEQHRRWTLPWPGGPRTTPTCAHTGGKRIGGGIARSYYVGIGHECRAARPQTKELTVVCVVPQHLEEEKELVLDKPEPELSLGQPVRFPLYTSTVRSDDQAGQVLSPSNRSSCWNCRRCTTVLRGGKQQRHEGTWRSRWPPAREQPIGTLEVCVPRPRRQQSLAAAELNIHDLVPAEPRRYFRMKPAGGRGSRRADLDGRLAGTPGVQEAVRLIRHVFQDGAAARLTKRQCGRRTSTRGAGRPPWKRRAATGRRACAGA